jgi:hypothetical protein
MKTKTSSISDLCREVTKEILAEMEKGFYYQDQYRHDPLLWDIGNGWCEEWGERLIQRYHELHQDQCPSCPSGEWFEKEYGGYIADHYVVEFRGKYYDAERPDGVDSVWDLPIWKQDERPG